MPSLGCCRWSTFTLLHVPRCQARMGSQTSWRALTDEPCQQWDGSGSNGSTPSALPRWSYSASSVRHTLVRQRIQCLPPSSLHKLPANRCPQGVLDDNIREFMEDDGWSFCQSGLPLADFIRQIPNCTICTDVPQLDDVLAADFAPGCARYLGTRKLTITLPNGKELLEYVY